MWQGVKYAKLQELQPKVACQLIGFDPEMSETDSVLRRLMEIPVRVSLVEGNGTQPGDGRMTDKQAFLLCTNRQCQLSQTSHIMMRTIAVC